MNAGRPRADVAEARRLIRETKRFPSATMPGGPKGLPRTRGDVEERRAAEDRSVGCCPRLPAAEARVGGGHTKRVPRRAERGRRGQNDAVTTTPAAVLQQRKGSAQMQWHERRRSLTKKKKKKKGDGGTASGREPQPQKCSACIRTSDKRASEIAHPDGYT